MNNNVQTSEDSNIRNHGITDLMIIIKFAFSLVWRFCPYLFIVLGTSTILQGFSSTVMVWISKHVLNSFVAVIKSGGGAAEFTSAFQMITLQLLTLMGFMTFGTVNMYLSTLMARRLSLSMRSDMLEKISTFDMSYFDKPYFYDMITRAMTESSEKPLVFIRKTSAVISSTITFVSISVLIASFNWILIPIMVLMCIPFLVVQIKYGKVVFNIQYNRTHNKRMANYISSCLTNRHFVPEVSSFGLWEYLRKRWYEFEHSFLQEDKKINRKQTAAGLGITTFLNIGKALITAFIVYWGVIHKESFTVGDIMMYSAAFAGGIDGLSKAFENFSGIYKASLFLRNLFEFTKLKPTIKNKKHAKTVPENIKSIELRNVSFKYPETEKYVLRNINITFKGGKSNLIVGTNGAGKSTLIKLLFRLYDPTSGQILLNGIDIKEYQLDSLRQKIGVIFQEFLKYPFSVKENIGVGCIQELDNMRQIVTAAATSKADNIIDNLPYKYDTILSKQFQKGHELSLGQWQRVCLARVFMKNAPVFIFDEPTANLDVEAEANLIHEIGRVSDNKICILISHRMFRKGLANRIVVIDDGRITEEGSHETLLAKGGQYARLWEMSHNLVEEQVV